MDGKQTAKAFRLYVDRKNKGQGGCLNIRAVAAVKEGKLKMFFKPSVHSTVGRDGF